jgi:hypothetical protein
MAALVIKGLNGELRAKAHTHQAAALQNASPTA